MLLVVGWATTLLSRRFSVSKLLAPIIPSNLDSQIQPQQNIDSQLQKPPQEDFEVIKSEIRFELKKTKIAVEYSSLSNSGKAQCKSLLSEAEASIEQAKLISDIRYAGELIRLAGQLANAVKNDSRAVLVYTVIVLIVFSSLGFATWGKWEQIAFSNTVFGVPVGVFIWSGIGGFVSVPYRYVFQQEEFQEPTVKWLFIRPIMGLILGTVAYFAFSLSLYVLDSSNLEVAKLIENRSVVFLILAFFAGFSDKFAIFILQSVIGRIAPAWTTKPSQEVSQSEKPA